MVIIQGVSPKKIPTTKKQQEVLERHLTHHWFHPTNPHHRRNPEEGEVRING